MNAASRADLMNKLGGGAGLSVPMPVRREEGRREGGRDVCAAYA